MENILVKSFNIQQDRKIEFYYSLNDKHITIIDSEYPNKKHIRQINNIVRYSIRVFKTDGNKRLRMTLTDNDLFSFLYLNGYEKLENKPNGFVFNECIIKKYINDEFIDKQKQVPSFTLLGYSENGSIEKSIYRFCYRKGDGVSTYYKLLEEVGIKNTELIYRTHEGKILRSYAEFVLFSYLHFNNIKFVYEEKNIDGCIPDFKLIDTDTYIELVGYDEKIKNGHSLVYHDRLSIKKERYLKNNIKVVYLSLGYNENPTECFYNELVNLFGEIKKPNIFTYFETFAFSGEKYVKNLKELGVKFAKGEIDSEKLLKDYQPEYLKILNEYGSVYNFCESYMTMDELLNTPKSYGYFHTLKNCYKWLDFLSTNHVELPNHSKCKSKGEFSPLYSIYRIYGSNEFNKGGLFEKYNTPYKNNPQEVFEVTNTITGQKFDGIYTAYLKSNPIESVGEFFDNIGRNKSDFIVNVRNGRRIKNTLTGKVYPSITECCLEEQINPAGFETYLRKLYKGTIGKSKYSHLVPYTANYIEIDDENYLHNRYGSMIKFTDEEIKIIHDMVKDGFTESEISKEVGKKFSRNVFYKSPIYINTIHKLFNEIVNEETIRENYPPKSVHTNFTTEELKDIVNLSYKEVSEKYGISSGTSYNIKNRIKKYKDMIY